MDIEKIINTYNTPLYIFDINILKNRVNYLKKNLPKNISLCYAIKANPFIVKDIEKYIDRFEVCSPGEFNICSEKNVDFNKVLISGVYKTPEHIKQIITNNENLRHFTIESMEQFELFKSIKCDSKLKILIRLTSGNQFGINEDELRQIIKNRADYPNLEFIGIQYFSGTQKNSLKIIARELQYVDTVISKLHDEFDYDAKELEFGPGFPVYYFKDKEFDEDAYLKEFSNIVNSIQFKGKVYLEIGRSIAATCGTYVTKVVDKKINKNQRYAIVDGGMNHLVYYGQSMAMKIPKSEVYPKRDNENAEKWNVCGSLCTINDILVKQYPVNDLKVGDAFIFKNTGAYCMTEGISLFLSRNLPQVLKINEDGRIELLRKDLETYKFNM